jgi:hypothetical protein
MYPLAFLALELAAERAREATDQRRAAPIQHRLPVRPSWPRRTLANAFALVSRSSADVAGRLDACVAEDLRRTLASSN